MIGVCVNTHVLHAQLEVRLDSSLKIVDFNFGQDTPKSIHRPYKKAVKAEKASELMAEIKTDLYASGYASARIEERIANDTLFLLIKPGPVYDWNRLIIPEDAEAILRKAGVNIRKLQGNLFRPELLMNAINKGLMELENNGFPFASFTLDSVDLSHDRISAKLRLDRGVFVRIDSVDVTGDLKVRESYLVNYLGIKEGNAYNERAIKQIPDRLNAVRFLQMMKPPIVEFEEDETKVTLFLNKNNASSFDGIVGFLPDNQTGKILITGDVKLHLENALKQGEIVDLNWRKLQANTQELNAEVITPYILNSPVSVDGGLRIYKRDTLFTDVFRQIGLRYVFGSEDFVRLFVDRQTTSLIATSPYESSTTAPPFLDRAITSYGLGFQLINVDYRLNPSRGFELYTESGVGSKQIIRNANLPEVIYDSLALSSIQFKSRLDVAYYLQIVPRLVWHQRALGAGLVNDQLFNNEAYRIGGLKTLRGFDEESIFATTYLILRNEIRYQFDKDGYLFGFFDGAWYENQSLNRIGAANDLPYGTGVGVSFSTNAGLFSLSYALGSQLNNPVLIRAAKIHFGFLSLF